MIESTIIGKSCDIGPFARLRPGTELADQAKIGNFVETKKTIIGDGSKVNHLSYIGDANLGSGVNIGAGTITCNYDGANKHLTKIGDRAFIGSNTALVAPVTIGDGSTVGAGSTITREVDDNTLFNYAIEGMVSKLDPYSDYLSKDDFSELKVGTTGRFGGIGIEITMEDGFVKIITPIDDTPAQKAGLKAGDLVI